MKAIDFVAKGNIIRVFLSNAEDLSPVHGDDWDDKGDFETVYCEYIDGYKDFIFPFYTDVFTCEEMIEDGKACKDDMKDGYFPMFVTVPFNSSFTLFESVMAMKNCFRVYFGDEMEPDQVSPEFQSRYDKQHWMFS